MSTQLHLRTTGLIITERCTLRCKLCGEFAPLYENPPQADYDTIINIIDTYFGCVDSVGDFSLSGGEPLLHPDLYRIIHYLGKYISKINRLLILTNGTIVPHRDALLKLRSKSDLWEKLRFHISDYGPSLSKNAEKVKLLLDELQIDCRVIKYWGEDVFCNGWVDYGDHRQKYFTEEEILEHAAKCEFRKNRYFSLRIHEGKGYLARCGRAFWRMYIGVTAPNTQDLVCITDQPIDLVRKRLRKLIKAEVSDSCAYCNGLCEDSERFTPAEQL